MLLSTLLRRTSPSLLLLCLRAAPEFLSKCTLMRLPHGPLSLGGPISLLIFSPFKGIGHMRVTLSASNNFSALCEAREMRSVLKANLHWTTSEYGMFLCNYNRNMLAMEAISKSMVIIALTLAALADPSMRS